MHSVQSKWDPWRSGVWLYKKRYLNLHIDKLFCFQMVRLSLWNCSVAKYLTCTGETDFYRSRLQFIINAKCNTSSMFDLYRGHHKNLNCEERLAFRVIIFSSTWPRETSNIYYQFATRVITVSLGQRWNMYSAFSLDWFSYIVYTPSNNI